MQPTPSPCPPADRSAALSVLRLVADLGPGAADALHGALQGLVAHRGALLIDGSDVERAGTPCLQVLVAGAVAARANGIDFRVLQPSRVLCEAVRDLGLCRALGMAGG